MSEDFAGFSFRPTLRTAEEARESAEIKARVDASLRLDGARAVDAQTNHTATALRRRALAAGNGYVT